MKFTDIFIRRPVMATAISLLLIILGLDSLSKLQVREYPELTNTVITVTTAYYGAPSEVIQGFITQPLQQAVAEVDNLDFIESKSQNGLSTVTATMKVGSAPNDALAETMAKVNSVRARLPAEAMDPAISSSTGARTSIMYIAFDSDKLNSAQIADYLNRVVQPQLVTISGVAKATVIGSQLAMRIWLDPQRLASHDVTASEVNQALQKNNFRAAPGQLKGQWQEFNIGINTDLKTQEEFENLIIARRPRGIVRLRDLAQVEMGPVREAIRGRVNGKAASIISVDTTPQANPLDVAKEIQARVPDIQNNLPAGIHMEVVYDASSYIEASIYEVIKTIAEASLIVIATIYLFIGNLRAVVIPVIAIPISIIGVCLALHLLGFSINLLTLLAMVLAIGLVVDDAIVVLENIERHLKQGESPFRAAIIGTREIASPVISTTIALVAVYTPIALLEGLTGSLFREFALTLAGAVVVSGIVALTLSPVMCAKFLKNQESPGSFEQRVHRSLDRLDQGYARLLGQFMAQRRAVLTFAIIVFASLYFLFRIIPAELAPAEDKGAALLISNAPDNANLDYVDRYASAIAKRLEEVDDIAATISISGIPSKTSSIGVARTKVWNEREMSLEEVTKVLTEKTQDIAGVHTSAFAMPVLPGAGGGLPIQFVIKSTGDYLTLLNIATELFQKVQNSGLFVFSNMDLKFTTPKMDITINRDKAGAYNVSMQEIASTLSVLVGDGYVNHININGRSYEVVPQVKRELRSQPENLGNFYVKAYDGTQVPLRNLIDFTVKGEPSALIQMDQSNAVTIGAVMMPGMSISKGVEFLESNAAEILPHGYTYDFKGESRQYKQEGSALMMTFVLALLIIFLVLAIQFESWRDAITIMLSVPLAICGALLIMGWGVTTMNIYTQIGLISLVGLITKHGILMCEVARTRQLEQGLSRREAIQQAAVIRLRPILMTTISMVAGLLPLLFAVGPGGAARFSIGIVICAGLSIGTVFTLFVLPVIYTYLGEKHRALPEFDPEAN